jgi:hypothetical protein
MAKSKIQNELRSMRAFRKKVAASKALALAFLKKAGIVTTTGKIKRSYLPE